MAETTQLEVHECRLFAGEWLVEYSDMESEGECYMVRFSGPHAEKRARSYWQSIRLNPALAMLRGGDG